MLAADFVFVQRTMPEFRHSSLHIHVFYIVQSTRILAPITGLEYGIDGGMENGLER